MLAISKTSLFKKDYKLCLRRGCNTELLKEVVETLAIPATLPDKNRDHPLLGEYAKYRECHITSDWLLIYRIQDNELMLYRTGTHSDLFGK